MSGVLIIDYGMGNLASVRRAIQSLGSAVFMSSNPADLSHYDKIILPGVGAFNDGMKNLHELGFIEPLQNAASHGQAILGICLGMQLLADTGYENAVTPGLGLIPGEVKKMESNNKERIPHVGWNEVQIKRESPLVEGVVSGTDFYFVHSYHFLVKEDKNIVATTPYCGGFASIVSDESKRIFGAQFHPEKSSKAGYRVLSNFIEI